MRVSGTNDKQLEFFMKVKELSSFYDLKIVHGKNMRRKKYG